MQSLVWLISREVIVQNCGFFRVLGTIHNFAGGRLCRAEALSKLKARPEPCPPGASQGIDDIPTHPDTIPPCHKSGSTDNSSKKLTPTSPSAMRDSSTAQASSPPCAATAAKSSASRTTSPASAPPAKLSLSPSNTRTTSSPTPPSSCSAEIHL